MKRVFQISESVVNNKLFKGFIVGLIILSATLIGLETYPRITSNNRELLILLDTIVVYLFGIEILLKILAHGKQPWRFFQDPWNVFDFIIVGICFIPTIDTHFVAVLRIVRILRLLRMISLFPKLRVLIGALLRSIPSMGYVIVLLMILFYMYAVMGVFFFGTNDPSHFGDLHHSIITLFKVITLEGWTDIMNTHMYPDGNPEAGKIISLWPFVYFASFILMGAMIIMNLFIGVIMKSMEESQDELNREIQEIKMIDKTSDTQLTRVLERLDELKVEIQRLEKMRNK